MSSDPRVDNNSKVLASTAYDAIGHIPLSQKGVASGVATLDGSGKVPIAQIPTAGFLIYKGVWDADTNTPTLADATGSVGWVYIISVTGTQDLGSGSRSWVAGNQAIHNGTIWESSPADMVLSVNTKTGSVVLNSSDILGAYVGKTANYTLTVTDYLVDCTANTFTVKLPSTHSAGRIYLVKDTGTGVITIDGNGNTIDGETTQTLEQFDCLSVMSNGTNWMII